MHFGCKQFLHVEILEGDEAWTEPWRKYLDRTKYGPGMLEQFMPTEKRSP